MPFKKLKKPDSIRAAINEYDSVGRTYFLEKYGFEKSREYMLRDVATGRLYDAGAIAGAAYGYAFPDHGPLTRDELGDDATIKPLLTELGFDVVQVGKNWDEEEVKAVVADYFEMLRLHAAGIPYKKSEHNEALRQKLTRRSKASIELKHQNISAILDQLNLPYIPGYKPRSNVQELLRTTVHSYVQRSFPLLERIIDSIEERTEPGHRKYQGVVAYPPIPETMPAPGPRRRMPVKLDYAARDERNRQLGRNGELWVLGFERTRLQEEQRPDLIEKIDWVSDRCGDGTGYDILSYDADDVSRFIEVKTTNGPGLTPFIVTRNEIEFAAEIEDAFCLYRVFDFAADPRLFILRGSLEANLHLEAIDYRARLRALRT